MIQIASYPTEAPVLDPEPSKRSRLPVVLFGVRSNPDRTGWTREERAVQASRVPNRSHELYLGPQIPYDHDGSDDAWRGALTALTVWRFAAGIAGIGGVIVPHWNRYDAKHQQQLAVATRYVLTPDEHGLALLTDLPHATLRLKRAETALPIYRAPGGRLEEIQRVQTPHREVNVVDALLALAPTVSELWAAIMSITGSDGPTRNFTAASRVARDASAAGRSDRWIRTYLETFGYVNRAGTTGRWHPKRLAEALDGAVR